MDVKDFADHYLKNLIFFYEGLAAQTC